MDQGLLLSSSQAGWREGGGKIQAAAMRMKIVSVSNRISFLSSLWVADKWLHQTSLTSCFFWSSANTIAIFLFTSLSERRDKAARLREELEFALAHLFQTVLAASPEKTKASGPKQAAAACFSLFTTLTDRCGPDLRKCQPENETWGWKERKGKSKFALHTHITDIPSFSVALSLLLCVSHIHIYRMYTKEALLFWLSFFQTHTHTHS